MEFLRDLLGILTEGLASFYAECSLSDRRTAYHRGDHSRPNALCAWGSALVAIGLCAGGGFLVLFRRRPVGLFPLLAGLLFGMRLLVEWFSAKNSR